MDRLYSGSTPLWAEISCASMFSSTSKMIITRKTNCCINVLVDKKITIYSPERITGSCILENSSAGIWVVLCLTENGKLYRVNKHHVENSIRENQIRPVYQEIFSDLLGRDNAVENIDLELSTEPVYILKATDVVLTVFGKAVAMCACNSIISVAVETECNYQVHIYKLTVEFEVDMSCNSKSLKLLHRPQVSSKNYESVPLVKIISADETDISTTRDVLKINKSLFAQLFGEHVALLCVPIIMLCPPTGSVYFAPITTFSRNDESRNNSFEWQLLCETSTSVIDITVNRLDGISSTEQDFHGDIQHVVESDLYQGILCVCTFDGSITTFHCNHVSRVLVISQLIVQAPVLCICSFRNRLYHSTGKCLLEYILKFSQTCDSNGEHIMSSELYVKVWHTKMMNYPGITKIYSLMENDRYNDAPCKLYCILLNGDEKIVMEQDTTRYSCTQDNTVNIMKNILKRLDSVQTQWQHKQKLRNDLEHSLTQISLASNLFRLGLTQESNPFECICKGKHISQTGKFVLSCSVTNKMSVHLPDVWVLTFSFLSNDDLSKNKCFTKNIWLTKEFQQNECISVDLPVERSFIITGFRLLFTVHLICCKDTCLEDKKSITNSSPSFGIIVHEQEVDILYFLLSNSHMARSEISEDKKKCIEHLSSIQKIAGHLGGKNDQDKHCSTVGCLNIQANVDRQKYETLQEQLGSLGRGSQCIISYLLKDTEIVVPSSSNDWYTFTIFEQTLEICVHETTCAKSRNEPSGTVDCSDKNDGNGKSNLIEDKVKLEILVRGDRALLAVIHRAISRRLQELGGTLEPMEMSVQACRFNLQCVEKFQKKLESLENTSKQDSLDTCHRIYEDIRSVHQ